MEKKLKIVIIGLGYWGKNFFRIVNDIENYFELIAIVDSNNNALERDYIYLLFGNRSVDDVKLAHVFN